MQCLSYRGKLITVDGRKSLDAQIADWRATLGESLRQTSDRSARANGNTSGGCPFQDEVTRQHNVMRDRISDLTRLRSDATVVDTPKHCDVVAIGLVITLTYVVKDAKRCTNRRRVQYQIVGYNEGCCKSTPVRISYETPLARAILGLRVGDCEHIYLDGKVRNVKVTAIRRLASKRVKRAPEALAA